MKTTKSLLWVPLGAGLLYLGGLAPDPPGARQSPATVPMDLVAVDGIDEPASVPVAEALRREFAYEPARAVLLETVVLQGTVGDKKAAIRELRHLGNDDAVQALSQALVDDDPRIRRASLEALSAIGSDAALAAIASLSGDGAATARAEAVEALGNAGGDSSAAYLARLLGDDDPRVRTAAVESLGDVGDSRAIYAISRALRDPDPGVRRRAAEVLDELDDEALFQTLFVPQ